MRQTEKSPCRCPWCRRADRSGLHRISNMLRTDQRLSAESEAKLREIVRRAQPQRGNEDG